MAAELERRKRGLQWLADRLGYKIQRVQNWTTRGLPTSAYADVAQALGKSLDWIAGLEDDNGESTAVQPEPKEKAGAYLRQLGEDIGSLPADDMQRFMGELARLQRRVHGRAEQMRRDVPEDVATIAAELDALPADLRGEAASAAVYAITKVAARATRERAPAPSPRADKPRRAPKVRR